MAGMSTIDKAVWTTQEVIVLLDSIEQKGLAQNLDQKVQRNQGMFLEIQWDLQSKGVDKDWDKIRTKWKKLKRKYAQSLEDPMFRVSFPFFARMHKMLEHRRSDSPPKGDESSYMEKDAGCSSAATLYGEIMPLPQPGESSLLLDDEDDMEEEGEDQFKLFLDMIRTEGEKDRRTTMLAVNALANAMTENINKLIRSHQNMSSSTGNSQSKTKENQHNNTPNGAPDLKS